MRPVLRPLSLVLAAVITAFVLPAAMNVSAATASTVPPTSTSHYVRNITGAPSDTGTMDREGCADARSGSRVVVLDIGAQSISAPLTSRNPGVVLSGGTRHLHYVSLVTAVKWYAIGFHRCRSSAPVTIAVTTNNDGQFRTYSATNKGADWASRVINPVRAYVSAHRFTHVAVIAGNDIEAGFASTFTQAQHWEIAYLTHTSANLVYVGSADGCPGTAGITGKTCARVRDDRGVLKAWTQKQYYTLAHLGSRIRAIPQIYVPHQATQWANIDATGAKAIMFAGALTEHAACQTAGSGCSSFTPAQGWTALSTALRRIGVAPGAVVTDLRIDS